MRNPQRNSRETEASIGRREDEGLHPRLSFVVLILLLSVLALLSEAGTAAVAGELSDGPGVRPLEVFRFAPDYSRFSHSNPQAHADLTGRPNCAGCHRRSSSSLAPRLPVHKDCLGCHLVQFTTATLSDNPICTICHTKDGINSSNPPAKSFPGLRSFAAAFDHNQHLLGVESARPPDGCQACHMLANRDVAISIPAGSGAHGNCYSCHSPGASANKSSECGSCHKMNRYSPTPISARSYRVGFSHATHASRERLSCESCHNVLGRGLPQTKQVSSILPAQHHANARARSCLTCHNGQRAFGVTRRDFSNCKRCHKGPTFKS